MARVVVVGAGVAGLCAATRLANLGHDVTTVEANATAGGQLAAVPFDGRSVDFGATTFTLPAVFRDLFRATRRQIERELDIVPVEPAGRFVFANGVQIDVPNASRSGIIRAFDDALGDGAGTQWDALIQHGRSEWEALRPRIVGTRSRTIFARRARPLRAVAHEHLRDPRLVAILGSYAAALGEDPATAPASLAVLPYLEQTFGLWTVEGGLHRMVAAIQRRAEQRGARFRFDAPVAEIHIAGDHVCGVELLGGEVIPAEIVVSTVHPALLRDRLLRSWRAPRRLRITTDGRSMLSAAVRAAQPSSGQPCGRTIVVPAEPSRPYVTVERHEHVVMLHTDCPPSNGPHALDWAADGVAQAQLTALFDAAASCGVDVEPDVCRVRTPADLERDFGAPSGQIHGSAANPLRSRSVRTAIFRRPGNGTPLRGLYLAGAGAHPGPGIPLAAISAGIVADLVGRA